ncbi:hypothetical protein DFH09DRAFT_1098655 [Mycena vulgaris]|nr:hypothetical protein DFH09DRAFT_1098655 [Mycena vulgaris]
MPVEPARRARCTALLRREAMRRRWWWRKPAERPRVLDINDLLAVVTLSNLGIIDRDYWPGEVGGDLNCRLVAVAGRFPLFQPAQSGTPLWRLYIGTECGRGRCTARALAACLRIWASRGRIEQDARVSDQRLIGSGQNGERKARAIWEDCARGVVSKGPLGLLARTGGSPVAAANCGAGTAGTRCAFRVRHWHRDVAGGLDIGAGTSDDGEGGNAQTQQEDGGAACV